MYPETTMGKDIMLHNEAVAEGKTIHVDYIIRAHKHSYGEVHRRNNRAIQLPCWQMFVPYDGAVKNYFKWQPDIGGFLMLFDEQLRAQTMHFIYPSIPDVSKYIEETRPTSRFRPGHRNDDGTVSVGYRG
jgi:hypothetical protein